MLHLARKYGRFIASDSFGEKETLEWLFWQVGNQGPMAGQLSHFVNYAPDDQPYARERYAREYDRCLGVLERRLAGRTWLVGESYSIADMICWPWVLIARPLTASLDDVPNVRDWRQRVKERPAVQRALISARSSGVPPRRRRRSATFSSTRPQQPPVAGRRDQWRK